MNQASAVANDADVVVIGAGIVGTAVAEQLQHQGHRVLMIDRNAPGSGCSDGNAGHFATDVVLPLASVQTILSLPKMLMDPLGPLSIRWSYLPRMLPWLLRFAKAALPSNARASCTTLRALNGRSIESFDRLLSRTGLETLMTKRGALTLYQTIAGQRANQSTVKLLREYGVVIEALDTGALKDLEPALGENLAGGLYFPNTAHTVNPLRLVQELASALVSAGGQIQLAEVEQIKTEADGRVTLTVNGQSLSAKRVVVAGGAWSKNLVEQLGYKVPLDTERGYHLMLPQSGVELSRPMVSFERSFVMTPMEEGLRLAGTVELAGLKAEPNYRRADILFQHASSILPGLKSEYASRWMGFRPSLPDSLPVIGRAPNQPNVYFAFGHQHLGLTQAAITAELVADLIAGKQPEIDLAPLAVDRF